jgi:hypothetical protein
MDRALHERIRRHRGAAAAWAYSTSRGGGCREFGGAGLVDSCRGQWPAITQAHKAARPGTSWRPGNCASCWCATNAVQSAASSRDLTTVRSRVCGSSSSVPPRSAVIVLSGASAALPALQMASALARDDRHFGMADAIRAGDSASLTRDLSQAHQLSQQAKQALAGKASPTAVRVVRGLGRSPG